MKFTLYIPNSTMFKLWKQSAAKEGMSLAMFIRVAVAEKIQRMDEE